MPHATTESDSALSSVKDNATTSLFTYHILPPKIITDSELAVLKSNLRELPARDAAPTKSALWKSGQPRREISSKFPSASDAKSDAYYRHDRWKIAFPSGQCAERVEVEESNRRPGRFGSREWTGTDEDLFKRDFEKQVDSTRSYFKRGRGSFIHPDEARLLSNFDYPHDADEMEIWVREHIVDPELRLRVQSSHAASLLEKASQGAQQTQEVATKPAEDVSISDRSEPSSIQDPSVRSPEAAGGVSVYSASSNIVPDDCVKIVYNPQDDDSGGSIFSDENEEEPCQTVPIRLTLDKPCSDNSGSYCQSQMSSSGQSQGIRA